MAIRYSCPHPRLRAKSHPKAPPQSPACPSCKSSHRKLFPPSPYLPSVPEKARGVRLHIYLFYNQKTLHCTDGHTSNVFCRAHCESLHRFCPTIAATARLDHTHCPPIPAMLARNRLQAHRYRLKRSPACCRVRRVFPIHSINARQCHLILQPYHLSIPPDFFQSTYGLANTDDGSPTMENTKRKDHPPALQNAYSATPLLCQTKPDQFSPTCNPATSIPRVIRYHTRATSAHPVPKLRGHFR